MPADRHDWRRVAARRAHRSAVAVKVAIDVAEVEMGPKYVHLDDLLK